jgi:Ca2+-binding EF-hand superfamily protein
MSPGEFEEKMRWIFTFFDKDGDGVVTVDELKALLNEIKDKNNLESAGTT